MIQIMMCQGNIFQASIGEAINPVTIMCEAIIPSLMVSKAIHGGSILEQSNKSKSYRSYSGKAINQGSILERSNKSKSYSGKAIDLKCNHGVRTKYCLLPNNRLKLTAPAVHASCLAVARILAGGNKRAPRPAA
jgi:hypothetical protein